MENKTFYGRKSIIWLFHIFYISRACNWVDALCKSTGFFLVCVIRSFLEKPFRNKCIIGTDQLPKVTAHLCQQGATRIFIQPGPFEKVSKGSFAPLVGEEREKMLPRLVRLYEKNGFCRITSRWVVWMVRVLYRLIGIDEDAKYLMMYTKDV